MLWKQTSSVWNAIALQTGRLKGCSQKIFPLPISVENILSQSRNGPSSVVTSHYIVFINFTHPNRYQRIKLPLHQTWQQKVPMSSSMIFKYLHIFSCFKFPDAPFISFRDIGDSADAVGAGDPTSHPVPLGGLHSRQRPGPGGDLFGFEGGAMMGTTGTTALALAQRVVPPGTLGGSCLHHVYVVLKQFTLQVIDTLVITCCWICWWMSQVFLLCIRVILDFYIFLPKKLRGSRSSDYPWPFEAAIAIRDAPNALEVAQFWRYSALLGGVPSHQFIQRPPGSNGMAECEC